MFNLVGRVSPHRNTIRIMAQKKITITLDSTELELLKTAIFKKYWNTLQEGNKEAASNYKNVWLKVYKTWKSSRTIDSTPLPATLFK